jgi:hypothetical protein
MKKPAKISGKTFQLFITWQGLLDRAIKLQKSFKGFSSIALSRT